MPRYFSQADYNKSSPSPHDSCQSIASQGNKSQFTTPDNTTTLPPPGSRSKLITPDNPKPSTRQSSEKARSSRQGRQMRDESAGSKFCINLTKMEELFPDFSQGSTHDFTPPPASLPNAKELVSGVFQDGTPVFSPHAKKPRASRFVSASHARDNSTKVDVPPPFDEKKVLASIDFLEKKVAALEKNRAQDEITIQKLQLETRIDRKKRNRSDSALGSTDAGSERGDEMGPSQRKLIVEKNRLEAAVRTLQEQNNLLNQAASESETNLDKITKDRDSAVSQLGVAYFTVEQLKGENQTLRERNSMLKRSVDQLIANQDDTTLNMTAREEALDKEFERRARVQTGEKELEKQQRLEKKQKLEEQRKLEDEQKLEEQRMLEDQQKLEEQRKLEEQKLEEQRKLEKRLVTAQPDFKTGLRRKQTATESIVQSSIADDSDTTGDLTYLSVVSAGEMDELRKTLEKERTDRAKKRAYRRQASKREIMVDDQAMSTGSSRGNDTQISEWITKDITLDFTGYEGRPPPTPSGEAEIPYFEDVTPIFTRRVEQESTALCEEPKVLSKPVPVAKQSTEFAPYEAEPAPYEEEPTLRPSQSPALALASVIKGLEDELSLAKRQFSQYQDLYNNQNPALAKRARKSLKEKMEALLRTIDGKADYIYSLYDVVEGQKQQGQGMSDQQLEATLQSLGIEIPWETNDTQRSGSTNRSRRSS